MNVCQLIKIARAGRPDIAAENAAMMPLCATRAGRVAVARTLASYPHTSGEYFTVRGLLARIAYGQGRFTGQVFPE